MKTKRSNHTNNQCCASKNINFVVKVPHEKELNEYRKREKRKSKSVKRLKNKPFKIDKHQHLDNNKWVVERYTGSVNKKAVVPANKKKLKKRNGMHRKNGIDFLFESPEDSITEEKINNVRLSPSPESSPTSDRNSSPSQKNVSPLESLADVSIKKKLFVGNVNMEKSDGEFISDVDLRLSCSSLSSQVSISKSINESIVEKDANVTCTNNSPSNNLTLHTSTTIPVVMGNNEENRHILVPNETEMPNNLLDVEVSKKRVHNNESSYREYHSDSIHESIDDEKINETTAYLEPILEPRENDSLQLLIYTENLEKHNEIIISSCKKTLDLDSPLFTSNNESQIDSSVFTEARITPGIPFEPTDEDNQEENVSTKVAEKNALEDILITQDSTESHSVNMDDVKITECSSQHISEIEIDNSKNILKVDISSPIESFTNELVASSEKCDNMNDIIKDETLECISPPIESDLYKSKLVEETVTVSKTIDYTSQNTQEDLLTMLPETLDEGSSSNELVLSKSPTSPDEIKPIEKMPSTELQVVTETEAMDETCTCPVESADGISTTRQDNDSLPDKILPSSHNLPIMASVIEQRQKIRIPTVDKFQEIPSPILLFSDHVSRDNCLSPVVSSITSKSIVSLNENSNSSNSSSESKCFSLSGLKRGKIGKTRNFIKSDESSDDREADSPCMRKRKNLDNDSRESPIKKVLTRIGNFRKACDDPQLLEKIIIPSLSELPEFPPTQDGPMIPCKTSNQSPDSITSRKTETCSTTIGVDTRPPYLPPTKQRIAHTPKNIEPSTSFESKNQTDTVIRKKKSIKKPKAKPGDKISEILEVFDKTCKERQQINRNLNPPPPPDESLRTLLDSVSPESSLIQDHSTLPENTPTQQSIKKPRGRPPKNAKKMATVNKTSESPIDSDISILTPLTNEGEQDGISTSLRRGRTPKNAPKKSSTVNENSGNSIGLGLLTPEPTVQEGEVSDTPTPRKVPKKSSSVDKNSASSFNLDLSTQESTVEEEVEVDAAFRPITRGCTPRKYLEKSSDSNENPVNSINLDLQSPKPSVEKIKINYDILMPNEPVEEGEIVDTVPTLAETSDVSNSTIQGKKSWSLKILLLLTHRS